MAISTEAEPGAIFTRRRLLSAGATMAAAAAAAGPLLAQPGDVLTPEMFGAKGDGRTNDSAAFRLLSDAIKLRGGGTIRFRKAVYLVGEQSPQLAPDRGYAFAPKPLLMFRGLTGPLTIEGSGAVMRCEPGLRYGTFDVMTGAPTKHPTPFLDQRERATPYEYMIYVEKCAGPVTISDLELDGNRDRLQLGGPYGDTGIQIAAAGIFLRDNRGSEILRNVNSHHHALDGLMIDGPDDPALAARVTRLAENVWCEHNGRQGCSFVGGRNWTFRKCKFNFTGRGRMFTSPGSGFDIEAEGGKKNRDLRFEDCEFVDNWGCAMVADSGDSANASFLRCRFVGTSAWSIWADKPYFRFRSCTFVGAIVRCYGSSDKEKAVQFHDCLFTDDPKLSPSGIVYREGRADGSLADIADSLNVLFDNCRFLAVGGAVLPWSTGAIYSNCTMRQTSKSGAYPRGTYIGHNVIDAPAIGLAGSKIIGEVKVIGNPIRL